MITGRGFRDFLNDVRVPFTADERAQLDEAPADEAASAYRGRYRQLMAPLATLLMELSPAVLPMRMLAELMVEQNPERLRFFQKYFIIPLTEAMRTQPGARRLLKELHEVLSDVD